MDKTIAISGVIAVGEDGQVKECTFYYVDKALSGFK